MKARMLLGWVIILLLPLVNGCNKEKEEAAALKEGCMDPGAANYDSTAQKECANCCYYLPQTISKSK